MSANKNTTEQKKKAMLKALEKNLGIVTDSCKQANVGRTTHYQWLQDDEEYRKATEFGKTLVNSTFTVATMVGMSVSDVSQKAIANLGWTDIVLPKPLFVGDTLYAESEVVEKRLSESRENCGIVTVKTIGKNQNDEVVASYLRSALIPTRGHAVDDKINY